MLVGSKNLLSRSPYLPISVAEDLSQLFINGYQQAVVSLQEADIFFRKLKRFDLVRRLFECCHAYTTHSLLKGLWVRAVTFHFSITGKSETRLPMRR
jgi:hypothetical protein